MEINWNLGSIRVMANLVFEKFEALLSAGMSEEGVGVILRLPTPPITCETDYCNSLLDFSGGIVYTKHR